MVAVSGSLPAASDPDAFTDWMTQLRAKCPMHHFRQQPRSAGRQAEGLAVASQTNRRELEIWAGRPRCRRWRTWSRPRAREQGIARVRSSSLGAEGALWNAHPAPGSLNRRPVEVVSTVGGDSIVGGLIYGLLMRESEHTPASGRRGVLAVSQSNVGDRSSDWPR